MTDKEALEYFYKQMENGNIKNDTMQLAYECAIDALEYKQKLIQNVEKHYSNNLMCAEVSGVKVATKNQILTIITETAMK